jgi:hypothetical protein
MKHAMTSFRSIVIVLPLGRNRLVTIFNLGTLYLFACTNCYRGEAVEVKVKVKLFQEASTDCR